MNDSLTETVPDHASDPRFLNFQPVKRKAAWSRFDARWYFDCYRSEMPELDVEAAETFYRSRGARLGHSPNRYFDESWYLQQNPDVAAEVAAGRLASGFEHYCADGYLRRSPHWLFSEVFYRSRYPELTRGVLERQGLANGYDHYLTLGDAEFRHGHWFFDPMLARANAPLPEIGTGPAAGSQAVPPMSRAGDAAAGISGVLADGTSGVLADDAAPAGPFGRFLAGIGAGIGAGAGSGAERAAPVRLSWYFDPAWYLRHYPEVGEAIALGQWRCALHHYLCNPTPTRYQPLEWFSESFYTATYPDVQGGIEAGQFRNGYDHFVRYGAAECRKPHPDIDLLHYFLSGRVQAELEGGAFRDPFAHWLCKLASGTLGRVIEPAAEIQSKQLFARAAEAMLPQLARSPLDFTPDGPPALSVIVVLHNQFALTLMAMASLRANFPGSLELILVDSGSTDATRHIERHILGAKLIRFSYNAGFVQSCNTALAHASAPALLYLNNDLLIGIEACRLALDRLFSAPDIGAVGAKLIRTNGQLQEAGSIIWRDGTTFGYLRDADPNTPEANFVRDVDYCSGAFLMLRTDLVRALGGFDDDYRPAYYEEADLCVRLRKHGWRVVYDPAIVVQHFEYGSANANASARLMQRNHRIFTAKHLDYLRYQHPPSLRNAVYARTPGIPGGLRILFVEDRIPLRNLGAGYVRSNDILHAMAELGHFVSVFPIYKSTAEVIDLYRDMPQTAEVLYERGMETLGTFIAERAGYYDIVWIGRTHNLERLLPILGENAASLPQHGFVLDTEAIAAPRTAEQNRVLGRPQSEPLDAAIRRELACAYFCQKIIAVSPHDASLVRRAGHSNVAVLGHMKAPAPTPSTWSQRRNLLFLGAIHDPGSPNHDSVEWFTTQVLPHLDGQLDPDVRFTVAGFIRRGVDLSSLGEHPRVDLVGPVDDLAALYDSHRVFIAPTRFAGGIPFKLHEAASYGMPIVASDLLCKQLAWTPGTDIMAGGDNNPEQFANSILSLYNNPETWNTLRRNAIKRLQTENDKAHYLETLQTILQDVVPRGRMAGVPG